MKSPQVVTYPYVVMYVVSNNDDRQEIGQDGSSPVCSFKIVGKSAATVASISNAIRAVIQDLVDVTMSGDYVYMIQRIGSRDLPDLKDMEDVEYYCRTDDYEVIHNI